MMMMMMLMMMMTITRVNNYLHTTWNLTPPLRNPDHPPFNDCSPAAAQVEVSVIVKWMGRLKQQRLPYPSQAQCA
eukprot:1719283-Amphidinium_carterae.1